MNYVLPFLLEEGLYRGYFLKCDTLIDDILKYHQYPALIEEVLTEAVLLGILFSSSLKYEGLFTLQVQGSGAIRLIVVDVLSNGQVRASIRYDSEKLPKQAHNVSDLFGEGVLIFNVDQALKEDERYQGVIELEGEDLTTCFLRYFEKSEHIPTDVVLLKQQDSQKHLAAGIFIQQMPSQEIKKENDDFETISVLMRSIQKKEVFDEKLSTEQALFRLFHSNMLMLFPKKDIHFECRCNSEKVKKMLAQFSDEQLNDMYEDGIIHVTCQFCGKTYDFKKGDLK